MTTLDTASRRFSIPRFQTVLSWRNLSAVLIGVAVIGAGFASREIRSQREELDILAIDLATTTDSRDSLIQVRDGLLIDRDQLTSDRDAARGRAAAAEARIAELQAELSVATGGVARLQEESVILKDRIQATQADARDQARALDTANATQRRTAQIKDAFAELNTASGNLSATRDRMIDVLVDQIAAERAGRTTTANSLVAQYNTLRTTHNRQVSDYNAALGRLRAVLA
jgi:chromosome segregation ATPase